MLRSKVRWSLRTMALATVVSLAFGSLAWGYDDDNYYRQDEARERGYRYGSQDGQRAGQYDAERGRRFKFKNDQWEDAHGYEHWMGNHGHYKQAYRDGYERAYRRSYGFYVDRYRDRDDYRRHDRDSYDRDWRDRDHYDRDWR